MNSTTASKIGSEQGGDHGVTSMDVVEAVADAEGVAAYDLAPLYDAVDPDAIDRLVASMGVDSGASLSFRYEGYRVTVAADGEFEIEAVGA